MAGKGDGSKTKLRKHFLANIGKVMDSNELYLVSGGAKEWGRRVRELRNEEGLQILTHNDRDYLKPGEYKLEDPTPIPSFERSISKETRAYVLERNGYTCSMCGAVAGETHPYDSTRKVRLQLGHIVDKSKGGSDTADNLRATCSVCNEGLQNISPMKPDLKALLIQVRRATVNDQRAVLKWLLSKFPK